MRYLCANPSRKLHQATLLGTFSDFITSQNRHDHLVSSILIESSCSLATTSVAIFIIPDCSEFVNPYGKRQCKMLSICNTEQKQGGSGFFNFLLTQEVQEFCIRSIRRKHKKMNILAQKSRLSPKDRRCFFVFACCKKQLHPIHFRGCSCYQQLLSKKWKK